VANDISSSETGFNSEYNVASLISKDGETLEIEKMTKKEMARVILEKVFNGKNI